MIQLTRKLLLAGVTHRDLAMMKRGGALSSVRRGAYAEELATDWTSRHRQLIEGTLPQLRAPAVVSHESAAVLHGLPLITVLPGQRRTGTDLTKVTVSRPRARGGGQSSRHLRVHMADVDPRDIVEIGGHRTTSLARTVVDLARQVLPEQGVALVDAALRAGLERAELERICADDGPRPGIGRARRVVEFGQAGAESPGESVVRWLMEVAGFPPPQLQYEVWVRGSLLGRADFAWPDLGILGEFDGMTKYGSLPGGPDAATAIALEKERERRLIRAGWEILRWIWADLTELEFCGVHLDDFRAARLRNRPQG
ncbi:hypothetical protein [Naumannella cuiyingiana]|uniref:Transcriptional regulator, AbiEi antitoxin, Type IV TA system n=1 Tax=Naumannella cuiyingiana TaxID=1347891 RepID=A0A7Z0D9B4_9ACTN|nr:hypothetical protein [Naumannella cuiyingiana]NYI71365.1 hypothetical protein [Naumannella cuiyingiana]